MKGLYIVLIPSRGESLLKGLYIVGMASQEQYEVGDISERKDFLKMDGELRALCGLSRSDVRLAKYMLFKRFQLGSDMFGRSINLVEKLSLLVEKELQECRRDLSYWTDLAESSELQNGELELTVAYLRSFKWPWHSDQTTHQPLQLITELSSFHRKLCCVLAKIKEASNYLKQIHKKFVVQVEQEQNRTLEDALNLFAGCFHGLRQALDALNVEIREVEADDSIDGRDFEASHREAPLARSGRSAGHGVKAHLNALEEAVEGLSRNYERGSTSEPEDGVVLASRVVCVNAWIGTLGAVPISRPILIGSCAFAFLAWTLRSKFNRPSYPLGVVVVEARRPSQDEKFWLSKWSAGALALGGSLYAYQNMDWMLPWAKENGRYALEWFRAVVYEKVMNFVNETLPGMINPDRSVTDAEVTEAVEQFKQSLKVWESNLTASPVGKAWLDEQRRVIEKAEKDKGVKDKEAWRQNMAAATARLDLEMKSPVSGLLWGHLLNSALLHVSQLYVSSLMALQQVDRVIEQNKVTMGMTSGLPIVILGLAGWKAMVKLLWPGESKSVRDKQLAAAKLKRVLADVERSVIQVYSLEEIKQRRDLLVLRGDGGGDGGSSVSGGPSSPMSPAFQRSYSMAASPPRQTIAIATAATPGHTVESNVAQHKMELDVANGEQCYNILRLRRGLAKAFSDHNLLTSFLDKVKRTLNLGGRFRARSANEAQLRMWAPVRLLYRLCFGESIKHASSQSEEYEHILKDLLAIETNDDEIPARVKIAIISKLKGYRCFGK